MVFVDDRLGVGCVVFRGNFGGLYRKAVIRLLGLYVLICF
jgi:hypothetical protein